MVNSSNLVGTPVKWEVGKGKILTEGIIRNINADGTIEVRVISINHKHASTLVNVELSKVELQN